MSSLLTQRLVNRFPNWSKARTDPSSLAYRAMSVYADYFEWAYADSKKILEETRITKRGLGLGYVHQIPLLEEDFMTYELSPSGEQIWTYPLPIADGHELSRVDSVEDLMWYPTTRLVQTDWIGSDHLIVYTDDRQGNITSFVIDYPAHLVVLIDGSSDYFKKSPTRNRRASGQHILILTGKDANGSEFTEYVDIPDDGIYFTKNLFSEITEVIPEGFDGAITLAIGDNLNSASKRLVDPWRMCILPDAEGPLQLELDTYTSGSTYTSLRYFTSIQKQGKDYRDGSVEIVPNEDDSWLQTLLDIDGQPITCIDFAINPNTTRLYCLDEDSKIHIYDHGPSSFVPPSLQTDVTLTTYLEIIPVQQYGLLGDTITLFTRFVRIRYPITGVTVKRVRPSGTTEYLQVDKTWSGSIYEFPGRSVLNGLVEESWQDFSFDTEFDEFGQWEFYCIVRTQFDTTTSYTGVLIDGLNAVASLATDIPNPLFIWFNPSDEVTITSSDNGPDGENFSFYTFYEAGDRYLPDTTNQILYLREAYDEVIL